MKLRSLLLGCALLSAAALSPVMTHPAFAYDDGHWHGGHGPDDHWHDDHWHGDRDWHGGWHGDIHRFHDEDFGLWRGGVWRHGWHDGRDGWFWIVGDSWYYYPQPVYPYPDPYLPGGIPLPPNGGHYYYFCPTTQAYYPYVPVCNVAWQAVPAGETVVTAPPAPQPPPAPPPGPGPRERDRDELFALTGEFDHTDYRAPHVRQHLKQLQQRVAAFREGLYHHGYDAMEILHDADGLEHRIQARRDELAAHHAVVSPPPGAPVPPPPSLPMPGQ